MVDVDAALVKPVVVGVSMVVDVVMLAGAVAVTKDVEPMTLTVEMYVDVDAVGVVVVIFPERVVV